MKTEKIVPISPDEALALNPQVVPDFVIRAFNELIVENINRNKVAWFTVDKVVRRVLKYAKADPQFKRLTGDEVCEQGWMDVETLFEKNGWIVNYDNPVEGDATFTFKGN